MSTTIEQDGITVTADTPAAAVRALRKAVAAAKADRELATERCYASIGAAIHSGVRWLYAGKPATGERGDSYCATGPGSSYAWAKLYGARAVAFVARDSGVHAFVLVEDIYTRSLTWSAVGVSGETVVLLPVPTMCEQLDSVVREWFASGAEDATDLPDCFKGAASPLAEVRS